MLTPALILTNISKKIGGRPILTNISCTVYEGELFGLIGKSGSGKTTLLQMCAGFLIPDTGTIQIEDQGVQQAAKTIGFSSQHISFYPELTTTENLQYFGQLYHTKNLANRTEVLLSLLGLESNQYAKDLSAGMQRRLDIACSLIHNPRILFLDGPTSDLDAEKRKEMLTIIRTLNQNGTTVIISSHHLQDIEDYCDRIAMLHDSHLTFLGKTHLLQKKYAALEEITLETATCSYDPLIAQLKNHPSVSAVIHQGNKLRVLVPRAGMVLRDILDMVQVQKDHVLDIDIKKPTLEDIFALVTQKK